ncbi:MAG: DUF294 nucleotidyltransferase-like domain-containing protein [Desulfomonilaceae bacterium]
MAENIYLQKADPEAVFEFLSRTLPFKELDPSLLRDLASKSIIDFYPKGTLVFEQAVTDVTHLHLIARGAVKVYLADASSKVTLQDIRSEGGSFGALGIIRNSKANFNVETVEDTFCYLIDKDTFLDLVRNNMRVAQYFLKRFSDDVVSTAYSELRSARMGAKPVETFYLFSVPVRDLIKRELATISAGDTIQEAAARMSDLKIGSLLVRDQRAELVGIVTDKDLRSKVVAKGLACSTPVAKIMARPLHSISSDAMCFDALIQMMNHQVHHLAVEEQGKIVGVITAHDIMVHQGASPLYLFREIMAQRRIEGLYSLSQKIPMVIRTLVEEGAKANNITRMISILNDSIVDRILSLLHEEMGQAPQPFCWLMMGSEGRREQTFKTDQDNALIYQTPPENWDQIKTAKLYFRRFGNKAIEHLAAAGYPLCKGKMMASNPKWRKPYAVWEAYFDKWMGAPNPEEVLNATIFFDFRPGYGHTELGQRLRDHLTASAPQKGIFLMYLAKDCLQGRPPLSFFRNFIVEKDGEHKNRLDIKTRGLVPIVDFARLFALRYGIKETNTIARIEQLMEKEYISKDLGTETIAAYEFQMQLRLVHQLRMMENGETPHNFIDPGDLSDLEKQTLKEAFAVVGRVQTCIKDEFKFSE